LPALIKASLRYQIGLFLFVIKSRCVAGCSELFPKREAQERALSACRDFLGAKDWAVGERLDLYEISRRSFDVKLSAAEAMALFRQIYDQLVRPAHGGGWGIGRNAAGPLWTAEQTFQNLKAGLSGFSWGGPVDLLNFRNGNGQSGLLPSLERMRGLKPVADWPTMAVSKVLHFYNAELFPVYDSEVIWKEVLTRFKPEFRDFCLAFSRPWDFGDTPTFYRNYMSWGAYLLGDAHPQFMKVFEGWLAKQQGANLPSRTFDASRLFATAYEYTIIGAYAEP
jgi:hypothetical protein